MWSLMGKHPNEYILEREPFNLQNDQVWESLFYKIPKL